MYVICTYRHIVMCLCTYFVGGNICSDSFLNVTKLIEHCGFTFFHFFRLFS